MDNIAEFELDTMCLVCGRRFAHRLLYKMNIQTWCMSVFIFRMVFVSELVWCMFFDGAHRRHRQRWRLPFCCVCLCVLIASVIKFHDNDGANDDTHHPGSLLYLLLLHNDGTMETSTHCIQHTYTNRPTHKSKMASNSFSINDDKIVLYTFRKIVEFE